MEVINISNVKQLRSDDYYKMRAEEIFKKAIMYIVNREYQKALDEFKVSEKLDPNNAEYNYFCGLSAYYLDKVEAVSFFKKASMLDGENINYRLWSGISLYTNEVYDEAKKELLYAYTMNNKDHAVKLYLVRTLNRLKESKQVIEILTKSEEYKNLSAEELIELGCAYLNELRYKKAINTLQDSIKLDNSIEHSYYMLSNVYCKTGEFDEAVNILKKLMKEIPSEKSLAKKYIESIHILTSL